MRTKLFFFASLSLGLLVASCQSDLEDEMVNLVEETNAVTRADDFGSVASIKQLDTVDLLKTYIEKVKLSGVKNESKDKQSKPSYTLTPYIYEGDTVMYVAQYEDGWELLSTDERIPLVLASTESGVFDLKRIPEAMKDYINSTAERVSVLKKTAEIESEQNSEWAVIHRKNKKATTRSIYDPHPELGTGYWELISTSLPTIISVDSIDHLVTTHWTQEDPFNAYTPKYLNLQGIYNNSLLGCSPVAVGQFLYYYYEKDGTLFNIPQTATYNSLLNSYSYSDFSYYAMNQLAKVKSDSNLGKSRTSVFLSYLGYLMNTSYSLGAGTTTTQICLIP